MGVALINWKYNVGVGLVYTQTVTLVRVCIGSSHGTTFEPQSTGITPGYHDVHPFHSQRRQCILLPTIIQLLPHFLIFNVIDRFGCHVCSNPRFHIWAPNKLLGLSLARVFFILLFLLCNIQQPGEEYVSPFVNSDVVYWIILSAFSFLTGPGYVTSLFMMAAPSIEHNTRLGKEQIDAASTIVMGSIFSFIMRAAVCYIV